MQQFDELSFIEKEKKRTLKLHIFSSILFVIFGVWAHIVGFSESKFDFVIFFFIVFTFLTISSIVDLIIYKHEIKRLKKEVKC